MNKIFKRKYSLQAKTKCICFCCLKTLSLLGINPTKQSYERGWCFWYNRPNIAIIEPYATQEDKEIFLKLPVFFGPQELSQILRERLATSYRIKSPLEELCSTLPTRQACAKPQATR